MLLSNTVSYLNTNLVPGLSALVCAGLLFRMISKIQKARNDENDSFSSVSQIIKKYVFLMIITVTIQGLITVLQNYYGL